MGTAALSLQQVEGKPGSFNLALGRDSHAHGPIPLLIEPDQVNDSDRP
jgi:hypothetical protein